MLYRATELLYVVFLIVW